MFITSWPTFLYPESWLRSAVNTHMYEHVQKPISRHSAPFPRVWPPTPLPHPKKNIGQDPKHVKIYILYHVQTDQLTQPAFKDRTLIFIGLFFIHIFNLVRAFFKEKKRVWMSKILRIFLRGQPNVPTQEKSMWLQYVTQRDFLQKGKKTRDWKWKWCRNIEKENLIWNCVSHFSAFLSTSIVYCRMYNA